MKGAKATMAAAVLTLALAGPLLGAGGTVHIFMSEHALELVSDPELKTLLHEHKDVVLWASWYPDGGYAAGHAYGEFSHWTPFLDGYLDYIRNEIGPGHPDYGFLAAHMLGAAAHGIQDQSFDQLFITLAKELDGTDQDQLDMGLDLVCMYDHGRHRFDLDAMVKADATRLTPAKHLVRVYDRLETGYGDISDEIIRGQLTLTSAMQGIRLLYRFEHEAVRRESPWAAANYMKAPGGVLHSAAVTAAYWESLWRRLRGGTGFNVIDTFPPDRGELLGAAAGSAMSGVAVFFDAMYDRETINERSFIVTGPDGEPVPGRFAWGYASNGFRFLPTEDLSPGSEYRVRIGAGIADVHGNALAEDYEFGFTTP